MAEKIEFELVSPERLLVSEPVDMVVVPGTEGDFGALARHAPMITTVRPGVIDIYEDGKVRERIFVAGGFAEVNETRITVLAEEAIPLTEASVEMATERLAAAERDVAAATGEPAKRETARKLAIALALRQAVS